MRNTAMVDVDFIDTSMLDASFIDIVTAEENEFRSEDRIRQAIPLYVRYQQSEPFWREEVISENISKRGLLINTSTRIPVQTRLYIESANREFSALAMVVHSNEWQAGLQIIITKGNWIGDNLTAQQRSH